MENNKNARRKKKKGFTLIELIIVMAILAILGAILVPQVGGYKAKAYKSNYQASAKVIVNAINAYNADATTQIDLSSTSDKVSDAVTTVNTANGQALISTTDTSYSKMSGLTMVNLVKVADGQFTCDNSGTIKVN